MRGQAVAARAAFALPFVIGATTALGFEPLAWWPLTLAGFAWLIHAIDGAASPRRAFGITWLFAVGHFAVGFNWIATAFTFQAEMPGWLGIPAVLLLASYLALFPALAALLASFVGRRQSRGAELVLVFAGAWTFCEYLRATLFTGLAWNPLGVVLLPILPLAAAANWMGSYGLSAVVVLMAGVVWLAMKRRAIGALALALLVVIAPLVAWMADRGATSTEAGIPVRIVQPNIHQDEKYDKDQAARHAQIYAALSGPPTSQPRILLWPEAATLHYLQLESAARAELAKLLGPGDLLILGGPSVTFDSNKHTPDAYYNSVYAIDSTASLLWRYDKAHLVPFGEYLPLRPVLERLGLSKLTPGVADFSHGPGPHTFEARGFGTVGPQICYEIVFSGHVVDASQRPSFLFNPSNDAWFGSWGPPQHFAQGRLRAIEEGIAVVRATPTGVSGVIAPDGSVVSTLPRGEAAVLDALVPPPHAPTIFARWGMWASIAIAAALIVAGLILAGLTAARPRD